MKSEMVDFPFAKARRITPEEVSAAKQAAAQFGIEPGKRDRMVDRTPQHPLRSMPIIDIPADFDEPMTELWDALEA
jgi:hypothetical protein